MTKITVLGSCVSRVSLLDGIRWEHGVADENLDLDYFLDKQNIVCAMYPPPFPKNEVDNLVDICVQEKYAIRSLKQNLNKETLYMLKQSKADYIVTDFMDMHMNQCRYNDTIFAPQANEFFRTNLNELYGDKIEKFRILDMPWEKWISDVDAFWTEMTQKYDGDHIILNRFRCNYYYMTKEGTVDVIPERFRGSSHPLPCYNEIVRRLEDYIIEKYNPYVIDLSKYFMGDHNIWDNLQGAHFEMEFYRETMDNIREIILNNKLEKHYSMPKFFDLERRGYVEDLNLPFSIEDGLIKFQEYYDTKNLLWINMLDKLQMHASGDVRVKALLEHKLEEAIAILREN